MIRLLIQLYILVLIVDAILSFFPELRTQPWVQSIRRAAEWTEKPVRKFMPRDLPIDPTPIVVILLLNLVMVLW